MPKDLLSALDGKWDSGNRPAELFEQYVSKRPGDYLAQLLEGLGSKRKRVQGGCAELASLLSAQRPELLYPHLSLFAQNLHAKEPVLRWEAACTLGNFAPVDTKNALPKLTPRLAELLGHQSIVLQGHAVKALAKIALAHPTQAPRIFEALAGSTHFFAGTRVGYLVEAMEAFAGNEAVTEKARAFLAPYAQSQHAPVARKAKKALRALRALNRRGAP